MRKKVFDPDKYCGNKKRSLFLFREYLDIWLQDYVDRVQTDDVCEEYVRKLRCYAHRYVVPALGDTDIREIKGPVIKHFYQGLSHLSKKYRKNIMDMVKKVLKDAHEDGDIYEMPKFPKGYHKVPKHNPKWLSESEQDTVLGYVPPIHRPIVRFLFYEGARIGEARALKWDCVYLDRAMVNLRRTYSADKVKDRTKGKTDRLIPLHEKVIEDIKRIPRSIEHDFVFHWYGTPYRRSTLHRIIRRALDEAGFHDVVPHDAGRHSFASQALIRGASTREVQEMLGHADIRTTERYTHVLTERLRRTMRSGHQMATKAKTG